MTPYVVKKKLVHVGSVTIGLVSELICIQAASSKVCADLASSLAGYGYLITCSQHACSVSGQIAMPSKSWCITANLKLE